jgi:hypothetical protein
VSASDTPVSPGPSQTSPGPSRTSAGPSSSPTGAPSKGSLTVRGEVEEGVEPGCMVLKADDGKTYLLVGGDRPLITGGGRLEVTGQLEPGLMTTCQQGTPFQVAQVRRI